MYEGPIQDLIDELARLPGIGPKSAQRLAFHLVKAPPDEARRLSEVIQRAKDLMRFCDECGNVAESELCRICRDAGRDVTTICVVEEPKDVAAISPLDGIGPEDLRVQQLLDRVQRDGVVEVILATNPNLEGNATAMYVAALLKPAGIRVTRLASGLPVGGDLEYADEITLGQALEGLAQGDLVGVLEVASDREAAGQAGHPDAGGLQQRGHVHRRRVALQVRVRGQDDLDHAVALDAVEELLDAEVLGADAVERADRGDVFRFLDNADRGDVAAGVAADPAQLGLRDVAALVAEAHEVLGPLDDLRQPAGLVRRRLHQVERQALRGLRPDARKPGQLVDEVLDRPLVHGSGTPAGHAHDQPSGSGASVASNSDFRRASTASSDSGGDSSTISIAAGPATASRTTHRIRGEIPNTSCSAARSSGSRSSTFATPNVRFGGNASSSNVPSYETGVADSSTAFSTAFTRSSTSGHERRSMSTSTAGPVPVATAGMRAAGTGAARSGASAGPSVVSTGAGSSFASAFGEAEAGAGAGAGTARSSSAAARTGSAASGISTRRSGAGGREPSCTPARRSRRSRRAISASGVGSVSGMVARTSASSSVSRGEVVHRMSVCAASSSPMARDSSAGVNFAACARTPSYSSGVTSTRSAYPGAVFARSRFRKCCRHSLVTWRKSWPSWTSAWTCSNTPLVSPTATASAMAYWTSWPISAPPSTVAWSSSDSASRADPSDSRAMAWAAASSSFTPSLAATDMRCAASTPPPIRRKSNRWHRPTIVAGILCGSVVHSTNRTPSGGSSNSFSRASNASRDSRWASSRMSIFSRPMAGAV